MKKPYAEHLRTEEAWCSGLTERLKALGFDDDDIWKFWNDDPQPRLDDLEELAGMAVADTIMVNENRKREGKT